MSAVVPPQVKKESSEIELEKIKTSSPASSPQSAATFVQDKTPLENFSNVLLHHSISLPSPKGKKLASRQVQPAPSLQPFDETLAALIERLVTETPDEKTIQESLQTLLEHFPQEASFQGQTPDYHKQLNTSFHRLITSFRYQHTHRLNLRPFFELIETNIRPLLAQGHLSKEEKQILRALNVILYRRALPAMVRRHVRQIFQAIQSDQQPSTTSSSSYHQPDLPTAVLNLEKSLNPILHFETKKDSGVTTLAQELEKWQYPCPSQANQKLFHAIYTQANHFLRALLTKAYRKIRFLLLIRLLPKKEDKRLGTLKNQSQAQPQKHPSSSTGTRNNPLHSSATVPTALLRRNLNRLSRFLNRRKSLEVSAPTTIPDKKLQSRFNLQIKESIKRRYLEKKDEFKQSLQQAIEAGKESEDYQALAAFDDASKIFEEILLLPSSFGKWLPTNGILGEELSQPLSADQNIAICEPILLEVIGNSHLSEQQAQSLLQTIRSRIHTISLLGDAMRHYINRHPEKLPRDHRNTNIFQKIYHFSALIYFFIFQLETKYPGLASESKDEASFPIKLDPTTIGFFRTRIGLDISLENGQLHFAYSSGPDLLA